LHLIDTHCHLDFPDFQKDLPAILARAKEAGVQKFINPGVGIVESRRAVELANSHENIFAAVGLHPHEASSLFELRSPRANSLNELRSPRTNPPDELRSSRSSSLDEKVLLELEELAKNPKVVAIGEIGLDYFRMQNSREVQIAAFEQQLDLAEKLNLPVIIHARESNEDVLQILSNFNLRGVFHCFGGDWGFAEKVLERGFSLGLTGIVTFPSAKNIHEVAQKVPLERLLVETDAPFLAPQNFRGGRCEPAFVVDVVRRIADLQGIEFEEVAERTGENAERLFGV